MKKIITLFATLFLLSVFAVTSFAADEFKIMKAFDANSTEAFYQYRDSIVEVVFKDTLDTDGKVIKGWNIGEVPSMDVAAWIELNSEETAKASADRYNLYLGAEGGFYMNSNIAYLFKDFVNLKKVSGFENVSTELLTNAEGVFSGCISLQSVDLTTWNTSKVITMSRMFYQCYELTELDLSSFSAESVTSMHYMFANCYNLKTIFVSDSWSLREDVTGLNTFLNCTELSGNVDYNEKNVSCLYATVHGYMTTKINEDEPDVKPDAKLDKTIKSYGPGDETDFHAYKDSIVSVTFLDSIDYISLGGSIENWDVSTKEDGSVKAWIRYVVGGYDLYIAAEGGVNANPESGYMFYGYKNLKEVNGLQNFKTAQATDMKYMFYGCEALESIDISSLDTENVTDMSYMFGFCSKLRTADLSSIDTRKVSNMGNLFYYCTSLEEVDLSGIDFTALTAAPVIFVDCPVKKIVADNVVLSDKATGIFKSTQNGVSTVEEISLAGADTKNVTDMSRMFENSSALISLDLSSFDLSKVKNMSYMFNGCSALESVIFGETEALNVSDMSYMFKDCRKLKTAEFGGVSVGSIKDMSYMFTGCISLQRLNFGKFNTALLQSLEHTFRGCMNLERIYVGEKWSIKAVDSGNSTFAGCEKLVGSVSYAAIGDTSYKAATLNGYLTPVDPSVKIPPVEEEEKKEDNTETEPEKLNFFQRIIQWFKNLFARFFGK